MIALQSGCMPATAEGGTWHTNGRRSSWLGGTATGTTASKQMTHPSKTHRTRLVRSSGARSVVAWCLSHVANVRNQTPEHTWSIIVSQSIVPFRHGLVCCASELVQLHCLTMESSGTACMAVPLGCDTCTETGFALCTRCRLSMQKATATAQTNSIPSRTTSGTMAKTRIGSSKRKMLNSSSLGRDDETRD